MRPALTVLYRPHLYRPSLPNATACPPQECLQLGRDETCHPLLHATHYLKPEIVQWLCDAGLHPRIRGTVHPYTGDGLVVAELQGVSPAELIDKLLMHLISASRRSKKKMAALRIKEILLKCMDALDRGSSTTAAANGDAAAPATPTGGRGSADAEASPDSELPAATPAQDDSAAATRSSVLGVELSGVSLQETRSRPKRRAARDSFVPGAFAAADSGMETPAKQTTMARTGSAISTTSTKAMSVTACSMDTAGTAGMSTGARTTGGAGTKRRRRVQHANDPVARAVAKSAAAMQASLLGVEVNGPASPRTPTNVAAAPSAGTPAAAAAPASDAPPATNAASPSSEAEVPRAEPKQPEDPLPIHIPARSMQRVASSESSRSSPMGVLSPAAIRAKSIAEARASLCGSNRSHTTMFVPRFTCMDSECHAAAERAPGVPAWLAQAAVLPAASQAVPTTMLTVPLDPVVPAAALASVYKAAPELFILCTAAGMAMLEQQADDPAQISLVLSSNASSLLAAIAGEVAGVSDPAMAVQALQALPSSPPAAVTAAAVKLARAVESMCSVSVRSAARGFTLASLLSAMRGVASGGSAATSGTARTAMAQQVASRLLRAGTSSAVRRFVPSTLSADVSSVPHLATGVAKVSAGACSWHELLPSNLAVGDRACVLMLPAADHKPARSFVRAGACVPSCALLMSSALATQSARLAAATTSLAKPTTVARYLLRAAAMPVVPAGTMCVRGKRAQDLAQPVPVLLETGQSVPSSIAGALRHGLPSQHAIAAAADAGSLWMYLSAVPVLCGAEPAWSRFMTVGAPASARGIPATAFGWRASLDKSLPWGWSLPDGCRLLRAPEAERLERVATTDYSLSPAAVPQASTYTGLPDVLASRSTELFCCMGAHDLPSQRVPAGQLPELQARVAGAAIPAPLHGATMWLTAPLPVPAVSSSIMDTVLGVAWTGSASSVAAHATGNSMLSAHKPAVPVHLHSLHAQEPAAVDVGVQYWAQFTPLLAEVRGLLSSAHWLADCAGGQAPDAHLQVVAPLAAPLQHAGVPALQQRVSNVVFLAALASALARCNAYSALGTPLEVSLVDAPHGQGEIVGVAARHQSTSQLVVGGLSASVWHTAADMPGTPYAKLWLRVRRRGPPESMDGPTRVVGGARALYNWTRK